MGFSRQEYWSGVPLPSLKSIGMSGVLKFPTIIVLLSISPFMSVVFVLCIEVLLCWMHRYLQVLCLPLGIDPLIIM